MKKMKRKRFKHTAFTICHTFCGWRLTNSAKEINTFGSGVFSYNLLTKTAKFENVEILIPSICYEIDGYFSEELERLKLDTSIFKLAELNVTIETEIIESKSRQTNDIYFGKDSKPKENGKFYRHALFCICKLSTSDAEYIGKFNDIEEWPENWPQ